MNPPTPLKPTTTPSGFTLTAIWSFPPFFTFQPNPQTFAHQLQLWTELLLSYCKFHRIYSIDVGAEDGGTKGLEGLLRNRAINRRLQPSSIKQLIGHMQKEGLVAPDPPKQSNTFLIYWRKPEEWARLLLDYVSSTGQNGSIMTFYEIIEGDMAHTTEFYLLPLPLLRRALDILVKQGKASIFKGEDGMEGVKFF